MKKLVMFFAAALVLSSVVAQEERQRVSPRETVENEGISVVYSRPYKKDREIFGGLVPYDKVWRLGADEATEITFTNDVRIGGVEVKAGTYSMFAKPGMEEWTIILNSELKQWGAYNYEKIKESNVAKVKVPVQATDKTYEQLTIKPKADKLVIAWDNVMVTVPLDART